MSYNHRMVCFRAGAAATILLSTFLAAAPADTLQTGRSLAGDVLSGDPRQVLAEADPAFIQKSGGPAEFLQFIAKVRATAGREISLDYERAFRTGNDITYDRVASFGRLGHAWLELTYSVTGAQLTGVRIDPEHKPLSSFTAYVPHTNLRLPFGQPPAGTAWFVLWAGDKAADNYHARRETHFAIDFLPRGLPGRFRERTVHGSPCWSQPILAAANGVVVVARDGMQDQPKLFSPNNSGGPGNYAVIDHGQGEFTLYGHLQKGSVRVHRGERLSAGQQIGLCGNSGASEIPHLHFQLQTKADINAADGLPPLFSDYFAPVRHVERGSLQRGDYVLPGPALALKRRGS